MLDTTTAPGTAERRDRTPLAFTDDQGVPCYRVPLDHQGRRFAQVWAKDFDKIVPGLGLTATWYLSPNGGGRAYVAAHAPRVEEATPSLVLVARVIAEAGRGERVRFVNGGATDLRRPNLTVEGGAGAARHDAREAVRSAVERSRKVKAKAA